MIIYESKIRDLLRFLLLAAICCAFLFLYLPMINNWFFIDDLQWIWSSSNVHWKEIFFVPEIARGMSPFFTPMLAVSFKVDWTLFGMNPMVGLFIAVQFIRQDIQISHLIKQERSNAKEEAMALLSSDKTYVKSDLFLSGFYNAFKNIYHAYFGMDIKTRLVPPQDSLIYCSPDRLREISAAGIKIPYNEILSMQNNLHKGPITIKITLDNYKLAWDLGPGNHGTFVFLPGPVPGLYYGKVPFPSRGSLMIGKNPRDEVVTSYFRILHETEGKEKVISPEFSIKVPGVQRIEYHSE